MLRYLINGTPYRLIGIGISQFGSLSDADTPDLIEPNRTKKAEVERAMDQLRGKFGNSSIKKGRSIK